jgi:hypothetical protein
MVPLFTFYIYFSEIFIILETHRKATNRFFIGQLHTTTQPRSTRMIER